MFKIFFFNYAGIGGWRTEYWQSKNECGSMCGHMHTSPSAAQRCASYWLNHSTREITKRARQVLQGLVARKTKEAA